MGEREQMADHQAPRLSLARQSLLGLAIGDAFGETMFGPPHEVARREAKRLISTKRPWRWTDDTAMALSIVEVLGLHKTIDPDALAAAFARRWAREPARERSCDAGAGRETRIEADAVGSCP